MLSERADARTATPYEARGKIVNWLITFGMGGRNASDCADRIMTILDRTQSDRAGVHTSGTLDREKAGAVLQEYNTDPQYRADLLDALEACVVPDPRIGRIEALCDDSDETGGGLRGWIAADRVRRILQGDE